MNSQTVVKALKNISPHPMFNVAGTPPLRDIPSTENYSVSQENGNDDAEISIFEAQKYFSEECNNSKGINRQQKGEKPSHDLLSVQRSPSSVSPVEGYGRNFRTKTASSEASWNSRTGLLVNPPGSTGVSLMNLASLRARKRWSAAKKWFLTRNCCCRAEKSVLVKEVASEFEHGGPIVLIDTKKSSNRNSNILHTDGDQSLKQTASESLPKSSVTDNVVEIHHIKAMAPNTSTASSSMDASRQQRVSATGRAFIDGAVGFTFPILNSSSDPLENIFMEALQPAPPLRRPSSMENHVISQDPFHPGSPVTHEDDMASDASSDLFEIESFSTQTSCPMHCWWDSVIDVSNIARKSAAANGITNVQHCRRRSGDEAAVMRRPSIAANECYPAKEVDIDCKLCSVLTVDGCNGPSATDLSVSTSEASVATLWPPQEEAGRSSEGKRNGGESMLMMCRQEEKAAVAAVKCMAEGPPLIPLHVGGSPPQGGSHAPPLPLAFVA